MGDIFVDGVVYTCLCNGRYDPPSQADAISQDSPSTYPLSDILWQFSLAAPPRISQYLKIALLHGHRRKTGVLSTIPPWWYY